MLLWLIIAGSVGLLGVGVCLWWWVPKLQMRSVTAADPKARADIEDNFRKTVGQALGGVFVLLGAGLAYYGTLQTLQGNEDQARRSQREAHDLLISNQVSKGFEQFGSDNVRVRLGGIYALEGVMNTSEQYHQPVLEALSAFVRDGTRDATGDGPPVADVQAALTVIGRRATIGTGWPDLTNAHIPKANLIEADLSGAGLDGADLNGAYLAKANMAGAFLDHANLTGADLLSANLRDAVLKHANLSSASPVGADLNDADLRGANLNQREARSEPDAQAVLNSARHQGRHQRPRVVSAAGHGEYR